MFIKEWIGYLVSYYNAGSEHGLTADMILAEIKETECTIENERIWRSGAEDADQRLQHEENIACRQAYLRYLRELMKLNCSLVEISLCIGLYNDPDELPRQIVFLLPAGTQKSELVDTLAKVRDSVGLNERATVEECFEEILNMTAAQFNPGYWYDGELLSLRGRTDLWNLEKELR